MKEQLADQESDPGRRQGHVHPTNFIYVAFS